MFNNSTKKTNEEEEEEGEKLFRILFVKSKIMQ